MDKMIGLVVRLKDEASEQMKNIATKVGAGLDKISNIAGIAGGAMIAFGGVAVKAASDAEFANKQLEHAVLNVSHATQEQLDATSALADELERKGVLDGDNLKIGLAQLSTFGLSNEAVRGLGKSMSDLAVNQFGVNASGDQLTQTANMMAKVLQGQFGVLEKSGIRFTDAQQRMILFGSEMEKVNAINEGFAQNLKLTNEVALDTFEGKMAKLNVTSGKIAETIGSILIPAVTDFMERLSPIIENVANWIQKNPELTTTILGVTAGLLGLIFIVPKVIAGIQAVGAAMTFLAANPIGVIIIAVAALTAAFIYLWNTNEGFRNAVMQIWNTISAFLAGVWNVIRGVFGVFIEGIKGLWAVWTEMYNILQGVWGTITAFLEGVWLSIAQSMGIGLQGAKSAWSAFWDGLLGVVSGVVGQMLGIIGQIAGAITSAVNAVTGASNTIAKQSGASAIIVGKTSAAKGSLGGRAGGGGVHANRSYLVGEHGPELLTMGSESGHVTANGDLGNGVSINITGNTLLDSQAAVKIGDMIVNRLRLQRKLA